MQLWYAWTTEPNVRRARELIECLDPDEHRQAERFRRPCDRDLYVLAHVMLRQVLAAAIGAQPDQLRFQRQPGGKPSLLDNSLQFNLSHTRGAVLAGVGQAPLGVDIECEQRRANLNLARRFFAAPEFQRLEGLPPEERPAKFLEIWTLKEAWLKALGSGLAAPLDKFVVHSRLDGRADVTSLDGGDRDHWCQTGRLQGPDGGFRWSLAVLQAADHGCATSHRVTLTPWPCEG